MLLPIYYVTRNPEGMYMMSVQSSLERAQHSKLLKDFIIYATPNVIPTHDHLKQIIECAGGTVS